MGFFFRKRAKILPGVYLNASKSGLSWSIGPRGCRINFGKRGTYLTTGIPGTGLYYRQRLSSKKKKVKEAAVAKPVAKISDAGCAILACWFVVGIVVVYYSVQLNAGYIPFAIWAITWLAATLYLMATDTPENRKSEETITASLQSDVQARNEALIAEAQNRRVGIENALSAMGTATDLNVLKSHLNSALSHAEWMYGNAVGKTNESPTTAKNKIYTKYNDGVLRIFRMKSPSQRTEDEISLFAKAICESAPNARKAIGEILLFSKCKFPS